MINFFYGIVPFYSKHWSNVYKYELKELPQSALLEPMDVLSEYKWQENLGYYQSTRDAAI